MFNFTHLVGVRVRVRTQVFVELVKVRCVSSHLSTRLSEAYQLTSHCSAWFSWWLRSFILKWEFRNCMKLLFSKILLFLKICPHLCLLYKVSIAQLWAWFNCSLLNFAHSVSLAMKGKDSWRRWPSWVCAVIPNSHELLDSLVTDGSRMPMYS